MCPNASMKILKKKIGHRSGISVRERVSDVGRNTTLSRKLLPDANFEKEPVGTDGGDPSRHLLGAEHQRG